MRVSRREYNPVEKFGKFTCDIRNLPLSYSSFAIKKSCKSMIDFYAMQGVHGNGLVVLHAQSGEGHHYTLQTIFCPFDG